MATATRHLRIAPLVVPWVTLLVIGTVMVGSAAIALGGSYLNKHMVFLAVAGVTSAFVYAIPPAWWQRLYLLGWLVSVAVALLVLIPGLGHEVNGAQRWIRFGGFSLQAAEVAKFGLCIYLAGYLSRHHEKLHTEPKVLLVPLCMVGVVCALLIAEPDLGSAVVIVAASVGLLFLAGARLRYFLLIMLLGAGALALLVVLAPYRMQRLIAFLDPWSVAFGSGYQLTQALIAFGRGEVFGLGLGEGVQKLYYLPEAHNDFIFAVVAEELGGAGAIFLALLLAYLVMQLFLLARRHVQQEAYFAAMAAYFTGLILGIQFLVNLGVNTGVLPTKGLTLPFVSYGGNSLIICCALLALVLRTSQESKAPKAGKGGRRG
jgi:cell division protein FtsW